MTTIETKLREIFKAMDPGDAQEIRDAYYQAVGGLRVLAEALEIADAKQAGLDGPLLEEHYHALQALEAMKPSQLGRVL